MVTQEEKPDIAPIMDAVGMLKCFYSLLTMVGGTMTITQETLDKFPADWEKTMRIEWVKELGAFRIQVKRNKIIKSKCRVIIPN